MIYVQRLILGVPSMYFNVYRIDEGVCMWQRPSFRDIKGKNEATYNDK